VDAVKLNHRGPIKVNTTSDWATVSFAETSKSSPGIYVVNVHKDISRRRTFVLAGREVDRRKRQNLHVCNT
jgi:hypothetical protein